MAMPVLDGWNFLRQLLGEGQLSSLSVIVMTGTSLTPDWAKSHGCCGFIRKPIDVETLLAEVRRCLDLVPLV